MPAIIYISEGKFVRVRRMFKDAGQPRVMAMNGREKVVLEVGTPPAPSIWELTDGGYYYEGTLEPVTDPTVIERHGGFGARQKQLALEWVRSASPDAVAPVEVAVKAEAPTYKDVTPSLAPPPQEALPPGKKVVKIDSEAAFREAAGRPSVK